MDFSLLKIVSENDVTLLAQMITAKTQNLDKINTRFIETIHFTFETEPQKAVNLLRLAFNVIIGNDYLLICFIDVS